MVTDGSHKASYSQITDNGYDDLTRIDHIKEARQRWLRQQFNVHTYQDLANLSVDEIEANLRADKQIVAHNVVKNWIEQARMLASNAPTSIGENIHLSELYYA